jgi:hypothetical protein
LLEKVESVIKRMRWKALFFLNQEEVASDASESEEDDYDKYGHFGFKSKRTPR